MQQWLSIWLQRLTYIHTRPYQAKRQCTIAPAESKTVCRSNFIRQALIFLKTPTIHYSTSATMKNPNTGATLNYTMPSSCASMSWYMLCSFEMVSWSAFHMPRPDASSMRFSTLENACTTPPHSVSCLLYPESAQITSKRRQKEVQISLN